MRNNALNWLAAGWFCLALSGCGGGDAALDPGLDPQALAQMTEAANTAEAISVQSDRRTILSAVPGVSMAEAAPVLFDFGERTFREYFPTRQVTRELPGLLYRYYPETQVYLAVIDWRVYVMGGPFGPLIRDVGSLISFVNVAPAMPPLTTTSLAACPTVSGSSSPDFFRCMIGSLTGTQLFDTSKACAFSVSAAGVFTLSSGSVGITMSVPQAIFIHFSRLSTLVNVNFRTAFLVDPQIEFDVRSTTVSGNFFTSGGKITVEAKQSVPNTVLTCSFTVPVR